MRDRDGWRHVGVIRGNEMNVHYQGGAFVKDVAGHVEDLLDIAMMT
jgi:hypothetical protein